MVVLIILKENVFFLNFLAVTVLSGKQICPYISVFILLIEEPQESHEDTLIVNSQII